MRDRERHPLDAPRPPPERVRAARGRVAALLRRAAFHLLHPDRREPTVEAPPPPPPLTRLYYTAPDGWSAPLLHLPAAPGTPGEPVVLAHALGLSADAFRYGGGPTLARHLSRRGFAVYLLTHRGDRAALPPDPGRARHFDFDDIVRSDLPAAVERACAHAGFPRVHWVGHGLGGQLGLALAGRSPDRLATLTALCAPAAFPRSAVRSEARRWARAAALLPEHWHLPTRAVAWAAVPWVSEGDGQLVAASPGPRVRGVLSHAVEDLPLGLMGQVQRWMAEGAFTDRTGALDYTEALCEARAPLLVVHAADDPLCPPAAALAAVHRWAHPDRTSLALPEGWGHLDPLLARDAPEAVFRPVGDWLVARRTAAWERDPEVLRRAR